MDILAKRLKDLRIAKKLSQIQVAEALNLAQSTYSAYECGHNPGIEILAMLAKYYDTSVDYLLGNTPSAVTDAKRGDQIMQRLARVSHQEDVSYPVNPGVFSDLIDSLIAYIAAGAPSGPAPIDTTGRTLRALTALLEHAAGDNFADLLDSSNELAAAALSASETCREFIDRRDGKGV